MNYSIIAEHQGYPPSYRKYSGEIASRLTEHRAIRTAEYLADTCWGVYLYKAVDASGAVIAEFPSKLAQRRGK